MYSLHFYGEMLADALRTDPYVEAIVSGAAVSTETNLYNLKIMDCKRDALISALRAVFVPTLTNWDSLSLPPSLHSLYYGYRPPRLSKVCTTSLWRKLGSRGAPCL